MNIGERIRLLAAEIERLDPSKTPFFMGIERPTPTIVRCMFQGGLVFGERDGLNYAQQVLAEVQAEVVKAPQHHLTDHNRYDRTATCAMCGHVRTVLPHGTPVGVGVPLDRRVCVNSLPTNNGVISA